MIDRILHFVLLSIDHGNPGIIVEKEITYEIYRNRSEGGRIGAHRAAH